MIKYVLVGLLLLTGLTGHAPAAALQPGLVNVSAHFETTARGVMTRVDIRLQRNAGVTRIGLALRQDRRRCLEAMCQETTVISGSAWQELRATDALIDRSLATASVHAVIPLHDVVANADLAVRIDVVWIATGPMRRGVLDGAMGCLRPMNVRGHVTTGPRVLMAGQTARDGWVEWRWWATPAITAGR